MKKSVPEKIKSTVALYFKPWRTALAFGLGFAIATTLLSTGKLADQNYKKPITSFHTIPIGHRRVVIPNFDGILTWYESGAVGGLTTFYRKSTKNDPVHSVNGEIRAEIPFQVTVFEVTGNDRSGNDLPSIQIKD